MTIITNGTNPEFQFTPSTPATGVTANRFYRLTTVLLLVLVIVGTAIAAPTAVNAEQSETTANLNLRSEPSLAADVIDVIPAGELVEVTGEPEAGFYPVSWQGKAGFAAGQFLTVNDETRAGSQVFALAETTTEPEPATEPAASRPTDIVSIIYAAAATYGQSGDDMLRVATCESNLNPGAVNASSGASGLFQFMPSTWATTPYAGSNIFDPVANANAAGWMWANGRRGEWECQ